MIRFRGSVQYDGGEVVAWEAGSAALVAWEAYCRRQGIEAYGSSSPNTMSAHLAYTTLGIREGFDVWLKSVVDVDMLPTPEAQAQLEQLGAGELAGGEAVPPTREGVSVE